VAAAALHDALVKECDACTVVAGDMVDSASMRGWMRSYRAALGTVPAVWSLHNYGDTTYDRPSYTEWLLDQVATPVWVTETGGIVRFAADGREILPRDEARAADSVRKAVALVEAHPARITRAYVYAWRAEPWEPFDSGLVRADGSARPSLAVLRDALGTRPPRVAEDMPAGDAAGAGGSAPSAWAGGAPGAEARIVTPVRGARRPVRVHGGYRLGVRCAPRRMACRGRVTLSVEPRVGGRRLALGSKGFRRRGGAWRTVVVPVHRRAVRRARAMSDRRLVATVLMRPPLAVTERLWEGLP
jgi:hypothetical protein